MTITTKKDLNENAIEIFNSNSENGAVSFYPTRLFKCKCENETILCDDYSHELHKIKTLNKGEKVSVRLRTGIYKNSLGFNSPKFEYHYAESTGEFTVKGREIHERLKILESFWNKKEAAKTPGLSNIDGTCFFISKGHIFPNHFALNHPSRFKKK